MAGPFKMKGSPMARNFGAPFKDEYSSTKSKVAGLEKDKEEYNKTRNWHKMEDGPTKESYRIKNSKLTKADHDKFKDLSK